ncbi:MAG: LytTR family DNA-binding domain-containing protein [Bacteroidota bacterium]
MLKVLIIEDEKHAAERLKKALKIVAPNAIVLETFETVVDTLSWLENNAEPDLFFMDIQLADGLSFEIFENRKIKSPVVFITAYDNYMINAFKTNGIDYLLKPVNETELAKSIEKFFLLKENLTSINLNNINSLIQNSINNQTFKKRFLIKIGNFYRPILSENIAYIRVEPAGQCMCTFDNKKHFSDISLDDFENQLDPEAFFRINRQIIININSIQSVQTYFNSRLIISTILAIEEEVIVSREKVLDFKNWMNK